MSYRRRGRSQMPPWVWIILGIIFMTAMARPATASLAVLLMVFFGIFWLATQANLLNQSQGQQRRQQDRTARRFDDDDLYQPRPDRQRKAPRDIANEAVRRAGNELDTWMLDLDDIGVLAYHGDDTPDVCRLDPVAPDTTHLRPFVVINLPYKQGKGTIRFEFFDENNEKRFEVAKLYQLKGGPNFITTPTWLPMDDIRSSGQWSLQVSIGDKPLAVHEFNVRASYGGQMRGFLREDGELDPWLSDAIAQEGSSRVGISLDDLLAGQLEAEELEMDNRLR